MIKFNENVKSCKSTTFHLGQDFEALQLIDDYFLRETISKMHRFIR